MRRLIGLLGAAVIATLAVAETSALASTTPVRCTGTRTGVVINRDVVVPPNKPCTLINSVVNGGVSVQTASYFQATNTSISNAVVANQSQTVFIDTGSSVGGRIATDLTAQVFVYNATVNGSIGVSRSHTAVQVCGTTVKGPAFSVGQSGQDILIGDPLTTDCPGNKVPNGSVALVQNSTYVEFVVRGNSVPNGNLVVQNNVGSSNKYVQNNVGGKTLKCTGNASPFAGGPNGSWLSKQGQCF
jgi:hypothetical protein